jgi:putative N6-adenine-specific DNA methylase
VGSTAELRNTQYVAQVVKDAVVDWFRERRGRRPSVDRRAPDLQLNARISAGRCVLSVDTSGERLHRRGYRPGFGAPAPLKESLAAGIVLLSGFDGSGRVVDPMCGSGTILVEAALIARNLAPGLLGRRFAFTGHRDFDERLWSNVRADARALSRELDGCPIRGSDVSQTAVRAANAAVVGAGIDDVVRIRRAELAELRLEPGDRVITNPPYGDRLGELGNLAELYARIGDTLKQRGRGASAHLLTGSKFLAGKIGLRTTRRDQLWNGALECRLLHYDLY